MLLFDQPPPAIIIPKPAEIIRPGDPRFITPEDAATIMFVRKKRASTISATFINQYYDPTDLTTYTASAVNLNYDKIIAVVHGSNIAGNPSSVTINGTAATLIIGATGGSAHNCSIWAADITPTASGNIVVVWSAGIARFSVGWYGVTGLTTITATDTGSGTTGSSFSDTLTTVAGGFIIIGATPGYINTAGNVTFSGTGLSQDYNQLQQDDVRATAGLAVTSGTSYAISGTYTGGTIAATVTASFGT